MSCSRKHDHHDDDCCKKEERVKLNAKIEFDFDDFCKAVRRCEKKSDDRHDDKHDDRRCHRKCCW